MKNLLATALVVAATFPNALHATDCNNPQTQGDMNYCAQQAYELADQDLNLAYRLAVDMAKAIDESYDGSGPDALDSLRKAQRAWIGFRDLACETESLLAYEGSMQPLIRAGCLERLTMERTEHLRYFGEVN